MNRLKPNSYEKASLVVYGACRSLILVVAVICILLTFIGADKAFASEMELYTGLYTKHMNQGNFNEDNELIGLRYDHVAAAHMINSWGDETWLLAYNFTQPVDEEGNFRVGVNLGLVYGYCWYDSNHCNNPDILPFFGVTASYVRHIGDYYIGVSMNNLAMAYNIGIVLGVDL